MRSHCGISCIISSDLKWLTCDFFFWFVFTKVYKIMKSEWPSKLTNVGISQLFKVISKAALSSEKWLLKSCSDASLSLSMAIFTHLALEFEPVTLSS